jgi:hypothetical protein
MFFNKQSLFFLLCLSFIIPSTTCKSKEKFYQEIQDLCYSKGEFLSLYEIYTTKSFSWLDLILKKISKYNNYFFKSGSSFLLKDKSEKAANMSYSSTEALEFYINNYHKEDYVIGLNNKNTFLNNKESRDYLIYLDHCYLYVASGIGYNYLHYSKDFIKVLNKNLFDLPNNTLYMKEILSMMYQIGRGLLYLFQNNYYSIGLSVENVKYSDSRGFKIYKLAHPLNIR